MLREITHRVEGKIPTNHEAVDHGRYKEDIKLFAEMGSKCFHPHRLDPQSSRR